VEGAERLLEGIPKETREGFDEAEEDRSGGH